MISSHDVLDFLVVHLEYPSVGVSYQKFHLQWGSPLLGMEGVQVYCVAQGSRIDGTVHERLQLMEISRLGSLVQDLSCELSDASLNR